MDNDLSVPSCRFAIDLVLSNDRKDIALHFNPRLPQNYVVRNSKINGTWGDEERCSALPFLLHRDSIFLIQILVTKKDYSISVNGRHFAHYAHRLPVHLVRGLEVKGDVADVSCEQKIISEYPEPACEVKEILYVDDTNEQLTEEAKGKFQLPYYGKLKLPFDTSHELHIHGRLKMLPNSFYVNLQNSSKIWPHPLIHFHFNPRFSPVDGTHILCCNSWANGDWAKEERVDIKNPDFYPSRTFKLRFKRTYNSYMVLMNEKLMHEFRFRDNGQMQPDTVYIQGDFVISEIFVSNSYEEYPLDEE